MGCSRLESSPLEGFSCKSFFRIILDPSPRVESVFDVLWRIKIPKKVKFFFWLVLLGHVNTINRFSRKIPSLIGHFYCILCRKAEENLDHLLSVELFFPGV